MHDMLYLSLASIKLNPFLSIAYDIEYLSEKNNSANIFTNTLKSVPVVPFAVIVRRIYYLSGNI